MEEEWRDIPGYEGFYQASTLGRIKRTRHKVWNGYGWYYHGGNILKPHVINTGRECVGLSKNGEVKRYFVHRLIMVTFVGEPSTKMQVNHLDGNPLNNKLDNLEWCDQSRNELHKIYDLKHTEGALVHKPREVVCVETSVVYPSLADACRKTGLAMHILFNRLKTGKKDPNGNSWKYVI